MTALTRWRPFASLLPEEFNRDVDDLWQRWFRPTEMSVGGFVPTADLVETPESFVIKMECAGMRPDDIDVTLSGDTLTLKGERQKEEQREQDSWHITERQFGRFQRTFTLPRSVDKGGIEAEVKDGVLHVKIMKKEEVKPTKVEVR